MIKYFLITTSFITISFFDGNINIYMCGNCIKDTHQLLTIYVDLLINNLPGSSSAMLDVTNFSTFNPPKWLTNANLNHLVPIFDSSRDILNNIGRRPNLNYSCLNQIILTNIPIILPPLVMLAYLIKNIIINLLVKCSRYFSSYFIKYKEPSIKTKEPSIKTKEPSIKTKDYEKDMLNKNMLSQNMLNHLHHFIPEHLRDFQVGINRTILTNDQWNNPDIVRIYNNQQAYGGSVITSAASVQRYTNRLIRIIEQNNITVRFINQRFYILNCNHLTQDEQNRLLQELAQVHRELGRVIQRMFNAFDRFNNYVTILRNLGVDSQARDFSVPIQRARHAYSRYRALIIPGTGQ